MKLIQLKRKIETVSIRHRIEIVKIIINACELLISNQFELLSNADDISDNEYPFILVDNMSRIFIFEDDKFFSIVFPLQINIDKKYVSFLGNPISFGLLSIISSVLCDFDEKRSIVELTDIILDNYEYKALLKEQQQTLEELIEYLLSFETGYIRYDHDLKNYKKYRDMGKENIHPEYHFDINYTSNATYKVGLEKSISMEEFLDCINSETDCWFLR